MPALLSHWLFGKNLFPRLRANSPLASMDENCFMWGCQGPDILFYSRLMPWMTGPDYRKYGTPLHDDNAMELMQTLASMSASYAGADSMRMLGYCMGMCCHYSLDRVTHPLIYWLEEQMRASDPRSPDYKYHGEIESMLDVIMLRREEGLLPCEIDLRDCLPEDTAASELIAHIYANVLSRLYSAKAHMRSLRALTSDMREAFMLLNDRFAVKRKFIAAIEKPLGGKGWITAFMRPVTEDLNYDYANLCRREWHSPQQPEKHGSEDFIELYERAAGDAMYVAECFLRASEGDGDLRRELGGVSFSGVTV